MKGNISVNSFTINQTDIMKGVAILAIMLHNILNSINPMKNIENEFVFNSENIHSFFSSIASDPFEFFNIFFSYLGHYGVEIFILLSGYGLARSFAEKPKSYGKFIVGRLKKIYALLITGVVVFVLTKFAINCVFPNRNEWTSIFYKFIFVNNFINAAESFSICGPWWFFSLIVQLYILFPFIFKLIKKYGLSALILISLISYAYLYTCMFVDITSNEANLKSFIGHLPEFSLGILLARKNSINGNVLIFMLSSVIFILGNFFEWSFPLTFLSISYISIFIFITMIKYCKKCQLIKKPLLKFGQYSMVLFVIHKIPTWAFIWFPNKYDNPLITFGIMLLFLFFSFLLALPSKAFYQWVLGKFNKIVKY